MTRERGSPLVSVIMPARNEAAAIRATLQTILAQACGADMEIVVADGMSTDGTREILASVSAADARVGWVDNPSGKTGDGLNAALGEARGDYVVRVDAHASIPSDYVQRLVDHLASGRCEGVGGRKRAVGRTRFGRAVAAAHGSRFGIGNSIYHYATDVRYTDHVPFGAYITSRARSIGGFDAGFVRNQDYEFDYRYRERGGRLLLDPTIVVDWFVREQPRLLARQYFEYGYWRFRTLQRHPKSFTVRWLAPPGLVLLIFGCTGASAAGLVPWSVPLTVAAAYLAVLSVGALTLTRDLGWRLFGHSGLALATMHLAWGSGFAWSSVSFVVARLRGGWRHRAGRPERNDSDERR